MGKSAKKRHHDDEKQGEMKANFAVSGTSKSPSVHLA